MSGRTLVILPTYEERDNLETVIARVHRTVPDAEILVVDDSSPDGTGELAEELAGADPRIHVLHRSTREGLGKAYAAGFAWAGERDYRFVVELDADGSHDPAELPAMLALAGAGADLVIGSRWVEGGAVADWSAFRQAISRLGNRYARTLLGSRIHDLTAGYRVFRSEVLNGLSTGTIHSQGYCFQIELASRAERRGYRVVEHPIVFAERVRGRSKMHLGIVLEALWRVTVWGLFPSRLRTSGNDTGHPAP